MKYTISDLRADFPDDAACLEWLVNYRYPEGITCAKCGVVTKHYRLKNKPVYSCGVCGKSVSPMTGTIFEQSTTPLTLWFYAMFLFTATKSGLSAAELQRQIGVTNKTAHRMLRKIRSLMAPDDVPLKGEVEIDETFIHPNTFKRSSARSKFGFDPRRTGMVLMGMVERGGRVKIYHVKSAGSRVLIPLIREQIAPKTLIHSDGYLAYRKLPVWGYEHRWTNHSALEFYTPDSSTQNIENVWSHLKRGIKGTYRGVSSTYLQLYANEYSYRYSHRNDQSMFWSLMDKAGTLQTK